jgi:cytochrome c553
MNTHSKKSKIAFYPLILFMAFSFTLCAQPNGPALYQQYCAQCHGAELNGGMASSLIDGVWQFGAEDSYIRRNIKHGIPHLGMPSYERSMSDNEIGAVVQYIRNAENEKGVVKPPTPEMFETMDYFMEVETFADNLEIPWAIDFMDKNTALITERPGRLRVVKNGVLQPEPVKNTPDVLHEGQGG